MSHGYKFPRLDETLEGFVNQVLAGLDELENPLGKNEVASIDPGI